MDLPSKIVPKRENYEIAKGTLIIMALLTLFLLFLFVGGKGTLKQSPVALIVMHSPFNRKVMDLNLYLFLTYMEIVVDL